MTEGLIHFLKRTKKYGKKTAKSIIESKSFEDPLLWKNEYSLFIYEYGMTPEKYLRSEKHEDRSNTNS